MAATEMEKPTADSNQDSKRRRDFAPPVVIKRLNGDDNVRKEGAGVKPYVHIVENGKAMAVFLMPLHGKALDSLNSLLETFHASAPHTTKKPIVDGPLISAPPDATQPLESEPTEVPMPDSPVPQAQGAAKSYSTLCSATTVEEQERDPDRSDVFGQIDLEPSAARQKERLTSVCSEMTTASNTTVIWVGSLTPAPGQPESSGMNSQHKRAPSELSELTEITVDWQDAVPDDNEPEEEPEQEEEPEKQEEPAIVSLMSVSPGSPKSSMHLKTPGQSGMPSPNIDIYSTANTPKEGKANPLENSTPISTESKPAKGPVSAEVKEKKSISDMNKVEGRPVVPFYYGSKIPVMAGKTPMAVRSKSSYGSLIAHQRRTSIGETPQRRSSIGESHQRRPSFGETHQRRPSIGETPTKPLTPKPHSCSATPLAAPKARVPKRKSSASSVKSLSRKDVAAGHFPGTPPRASTPSIITTGGSPRPKSSSKIPIPSPTTPRSSEARKQVTEMFGFGDNFLSDIVEADCENEAIWDKRRNEVMGPLGVSPTTRLGGFVRPTSSLTKSSKGGQIATSRPMASLNAIGARMVTSSSSSSVSPSPRSSNDALAMK